jgi:hypothetical protein
MDVGIRALELARSSEIETIPPLRQYVGLTGWLKNLLACQGKLREGGLALGLTMEQPQSEWLSARTVHLVGGCRGFNGFDPTVEFFPQTLDGKVMRYESRKYGRLYAELASMGIAPIGFEFLTNSLEAKQLVPTNWRTYHPWGAKKIWPCNDEMDRWAHISFAASQVDDAVLWDIARRVSYQLRVCAWRLYQLSEAYRAQLHARTAERDFSPGVRFEDGFTWLGYLAVQVFLVDACVLRDYFAEFFATYACPDSAKAKIHISTMAGLRRSVLTKASSTDSLFNDLASATSKDGWLYVLGAYRDLAVHCVPLARAESKLWALATEFPIKGAKALAAVSLPLPTDPSGIAAARASPTRSERIAQDLRLLTGATRGDVPSTDALVYCYSILDKLTRLAMQLAERSPIAPKIPEFNEKNIVGKIEVRRV